MLRRARHQDKHSRILHDELGRNFWGTPGPNLRRQLLRAFVEEIGHDYILEDALAKSATETDAGTATKEVRVALRDMTLSTASRAISMGRIGNWELDRRASDGDDEDDFK